jgi:hypothetical protein
MELLDIKGKVETAFTRILQPYVDSGELNAFQLVYRFFNGTLRARRISTVCGETSPLLRAEDNTVILWSVPVVVEVCVNLKDENDPCTSGYEQYGMKDMDGRQVPNCIPIKEN